MPKNTNSIAENYQKAWDKVFNSYPEWQQKEINRFVKSGQINNRHYLEFIDEVIRVAEEFENIKENES